ncbi:MAG TPA: HlyD family secretion protein [Verrucomicrobiae bacterium]|nr:HlyD family secretion protein [Verrucomicrobiae bacterium]
MNTGTETSASTPASPTKPAVLASPESEDKGRPGNGRLLRIFAVVAPLLVIVFGVYYFVALRPYESTDDAFIDGHAIQISPQVPGRVVAVLIRDNQFVRKGDPLVQIDPRDYDVALAQARANLAAAQSRLAESHQQVIVSKAKADQDRAAVGVAEAEAIRAQADLGRYQDIESRAVSRQQVDTARAAAQSSTAALEEARQKANASAAQVDQAKTQVPTANAVVEQAEAALRQAELNRSYADIVAPEDGWVTHRVVEQGQYLQVGQALMAIVQPDVWVTANFKETQLTYMKPGQPVWIEIDAFPQRKFKGHVDSIQAGTGAQFSLLPPENAAGNYVKVVQRVPVKIVFDERSDPSQMLPLGASVVPEVKVR